MKDFKPTFCLRMISVQKLQSFVRNSRTLKRYTILKREKMWYILCMLVLISFTQCNAHIRLVNPTPRSDDSGIKGPVDTLDWSGSSSILIPCVVSMWRRRILEVWRQHSLHYIDSWSLYTEMGRNC